VLGANADARDVRFETCPYDGSRIDAEHYSGGSVLLRCEHCGAAWEWHNAWIRRVAEPDRARLRAQRAQHDQHEQCPDALPVE